MADTVLPSILFVLFALLSAAGMLFVVAHLRSRAAGIVAALFTLFFFAALFLGLLALMPEGTLPGS